MTLALWGRGMKLYIGSGLGLTPGTVAQTVGWYGGGAAEKLRAGQQKHRIIVDRLLADLERYREQVRSGTCINKRHSASSVSVIYSNVVMSSSLA